MAPTVSPPSQTTGITPSPPSQTTGITPSSSSQTTGVTPSPPSSASQGTETYKNYLKITFYICSLMSKYVGSGSVENYCFVFIFHVFPD